MNTKKCNKCNTTKSTTEFHKKKDSKDGLTASCKPCTYDRILNFHRTRHGLISNIYSCQIQSSKKRNHHRPKYSKDELHDWIMSLDKFESLYRAWVESDYDKNLRPSIDRIDDYEGYSFDNIQLTTWIENDNRMRRDRLNGINNKGSKSVVQSDLCGNDIAVFHSISEAYRQTGISAGNISNCCIGTVKTAGKYKWRYNEK